MLATADYRVLPGAALDLQARPTSYDGPLKKEAGEELLAAAQRRLIELEELLYADGRHALLAVFQGMDTSGKDSTIRRVFAGLNPAAVLATSFKAPSELELRHDFLWRIHAAVPRRGHIGIFNRSHYEDVLIARVRQLVPGEVWQRRYAHINAFERLLVDSGVTVVKFFLHISKDYQRERLQRRLDNPSKHWKFNPADLAERARWDDYQQAYTDALQECATDHAPWYVVPAESRWFRDLLVASVLVQALERLSLRYPRPKFDPRSITID